MKRNVNHHNVYLEKKDNLKNISTSTQSTFSNTRNAISHKIVRRGIQRNKTCLGFPASKVHDSPGPALPAIPCLPALPVSSDLPSHPSLPASPDLAPPFPKKSISASVEASADDTTKTLNVHQIKYARSTKGHLAKNHIDGIAKRERNLIATKLDLLKKSSFKPFKMSVNSSKRDTVSDSGGASIDLPSNKLLDELTTSERENDTAAMSVVGVNPMNEETQVFEKDLTPVIHETSIAKNNKNNSINNNHILDNNNKVDAIPLKEYSQDETTTNTIVKFLSSVRSIDEELVDNSITSLSTLGNYDDTV